jgi:uncharacterized OB-fold protein
MASRRPDRVLRPVDEQFWKFCSDGELRMQRCLDCAHISWPPTETCERCGRARLSWELLSGRGTVVSWCTFERKYYDILPVPWDTILIRLEEGPLFISNPAGFTGANTRADMRVSVDFIDCEDGHGAFSLPVFAQAEDQALADRALSDGSSAEGEKKEEPK